MGITMPLIDRHILREWLKIFAMTLIAMIGMLLISAVYNNLQDLLDWGARVIKGETERTRNGGGNPIYSPSIALVKVNYENFKQAYASQKQFQQNSARCSAEVAQFRQEADEYILTLWNDIEAYFMSIADEEERRQKCENYGLVYVFRKGERENIRRKKEAEKITLRLPFNE